MGKSARQKLVKGCFHSTAKQNLMYMHSNMNSVSLAGPAMVQLVVFKLWFTVLIEITALSETRFAEIGEIKAVGAGYTFFWGGR